MAVARMFLLMFLWPAPLVKPKSHPKPPSYTQNNNKVTPKYLGISQKTFSHQNHNFYLELYFISFISRPEGGNRMLHITIHHRYWCSNTWASPKGMFFYQNHTVYRELYLISFIPDPEGVNLPLCIRIHASITAQNHQNHKNHTQNPKNPPQDHQKQQDRNHNHRNPAQNVNKNLPKQAHNKFIKISKKHR